MKFFNYRYRARLKKNLVVAEETPNKVSSRQRPTGSITNQLAEFQFTQATTITPTG